MLQINLLKIWIIKMGKKIWKGLLSFGITFSHSSKTYHVRERSSAYLFRFRRYRFCFHTAQFLYTVLCTVLVLFENWIGESLRTGHFYMYFFYVRRMRVELTRRCRHYPLKVACIPISPPALIRCPEQGSNLHVVANTSPWN